MSSTFKRESFGSKVQGCKFSLVHSRIAMETGFTPICHEVAALTKRPLNAYTAIMADADTKCPKRRFIDFLTQKNLRLTSQRQAIIESVFSTEQQDRKS